MIGQQRNFKRTLRDNKDKLENINKIKEIDNVFQKFNFDIKRKKRIKLYFIGTKMEKIDQK